MSFEDIEQVCESHRGEGFRLSKTLHRVKIVNQSTNVTNALEPLLELRRISKNDNAGNGQRMRGYADERYSSFQFLLCF